MKFKVTSILLLAILCSLIACQKTSTRNVSNNNNGSPDSLLQAVVYEKEFPDQQWIQSGSYLGNNTEMGYIVLNIPELTHITYYYLSIQQMVAGGNWEEVEYRPDLSSAISAYFVGSLRQNFYIDEAWQNGRIRIYNPFRRMSPVRIRIRAIR